MNKKIGLGSIVVVMILSGIYYDYQKRQLKKEGDQNAQNHLGKRKIAFHFFQKKNGKKHIAFGDKIKLTYSLHLADNTRPNQAGKIIEQKRYLKNEDSILFKEHLFLPGLEEALLQMTVGSKLWVFIPWEQGFGDKAVGGNLVPAKQDLVAIIQVLE